MYQKVSGFKACFTNNARNSQIAIATKNPLLITKGIVCPPPWKSCHCGGSLMLKRWCHQHQVLHFLFLQGAYLVVEVDLDRHDDRSRGAEPEAAALLLVLASLVLLICTTSLRPSPHQLSIPHIVYPKCFDFIHLLLLSSECLKAFLLVCSQVLQESWSHIVLSNCNMLPCTVSLSL